MKRWILIMLGTFLTVMPVHATEYDEIPVEKEMTVETEEAVEDSGEDLPVEPEKESEEENNSEDWTSQEPKEEESIPNDEAEQEEEFFESEEEQDTQISVPQTDIIETMEAVYIPEVVGMPLADAIAMLKAIVLPDGTEIEVITEYKYTRMAQNDIVFEQSVSGMVSVEEAKKVAIAISMGVDPTETIVDGITEPLDQKIVSKYGIIWEEQPEVYEYNWDNSKNCWEQGVWIDNVKYITPEGTYNTNVRHKIQLYTDGTYVYTHIIFSRDYEAAANGNWYQYFVDGNRASFQIETYNGTQLANKQLAPGTYEVVVKHADGSFSGQVANGASAFYTVFDSQVNAHLEMRIPLSEMAAQNNQIDVDSFGEITFTTENLMMGYITAAGADTNPFAMAIAAFAIVPAAYVLNRKRKKL